MLVLIRTLPRRPCQLQTWVCWTFLHLEHRILKMVWQSMLGMIFKELLVHTILLTRMVFFSSPALLVYPGVLQILLLLFGKLHLRTQVDGNTKETVQHQIWALAQVEVHELGIQNLFMEIDWRVMGHPGQLQFGLRLEKQWVKFPSPNNMFCLFKYLFSGTLCFLCSAFLFTLPIWGCSKFVFGAEGGSSRSCTSPECVLWTGIMHERKGQKAVHTQTDRYANNRNMSQVRGVCGFHGMKEWFWIMYPPRICPLRPIKKEEE